MVIKDNTTNGKADNLYMAFDDNDESGFIEHNTPITIGDNFNTDSRIGITHYMTVSAEGDVQENIDADTEEKAKEAVTVALPEPTKFTENGITGEKEQSYREMFEKKVTGEAGNYKVEIVLTKEAEEQVQKSVDEAVKKLAEELSTKAFKTNHDRQFKLDVDKAVPGIYYSVESTATLDNPEWSASTSERVLRCRSRAIRTRPARSTSMSAVRNSPATVRSPAG